MLRVCGEGEGGAVGLGEGDEPASLSVAVLDLNEDLIAPCEEEDAEADGVRSFAMGPPPVEVATAESFSLDGELTKSWDTMLDT